MPLEIRHLCPLLQVFDMPTSVRFYCDVLGFAVALTSEPGEHFDWCLLRRDGLELMLNTRYERHARPDAPEPARVAAHDDVTLYLSCPDVDGAYAHLRAHGIDVQPPVVRPYGMKQVYAHDPDGFGICCQWPATES